jgi:hypothetical protein
MANHYITLTGAAPGDAGDEARTSSLVITGGEPGIKVLGELPHGYIFTPATDEDRYALCEWLLNLEYPEEKS